MKRIIIVALFCVLGFGPSVFASTVLHDIPYSVPYTYNGTTYNQLFQVYTDSGQDYIYYFNTTNPNLNFGWTNVSGYLYFLYYPIYSICYLYNPSTSVFEKVRYSCPGIIRPAHQYPLADEIRTTLPIQSNANMSWTSPPWNQTISGFYSPVANGQLLLPAGNGITTQVSVSRSPEEGGGVASLLEYEEEPDCQNPEGILCGVCGYNYCVGEVPYSSAVKFGAFSNPGYAFDHWEWNEGGSSSTVNPAILTVTSALDAVAVFKPQFTFPLYGYTPTTVPISAVVDDSVFDTTPVQFYPSTLDGIVKAFNGEIGDSNYDSNYVNGVWGYAMDENYTHFLSGYNYTGSEYLYYDGHPGFDFAVTDGTDVIAPADGKLYWATIDPVNGSPSTFGTFYIDHENGYTTWYLHCSGLTQDVAAEIQQNGYAEVTRGDHIAETGDKGAPGQYHLHFEVRRNGIDDVNVVDPYKEGLWE